MDESESFTSLLFVLSEVFKAPLELVRFANVPQEVNVTNIVNVSIVVTILYFVILFILQK
ncbi:hypothetical protein D1641_12020 [Colidextribacter sp. OB.20]|nr:hypothetical protein [Colidextribacter sp. OB.20]